MHMPQIRMESTFIKLGLNIEKPQQEIEQPQAVQTIEQPKAEIRMQTTKGQLTIDQTKAREDVDLKSVFRRVEEAAADGRQAWLEGMARRSQEGYELRQIQNKGNTIARQAAENGTRDPKQFNIGWIPSLFSVQIDYQPGDLTIDVQTHKPDIQVQTQKPIINYQQGKVTPEILQENSLTIDFVW